jgi:hypothetical protein
MRAEVAMFSSPETDETDYRFLRAFPYNQIPTNGLNALPQAAFSNFFIELIPFL